MGVPALREWLAGLELRLGEGPVPERWTMLAWVAGREVPLYEAELHQALRRAILLLAAGGDPHRELAMDGRAVTGLAAELDRPERRAALGRGLEALLADATGLARTQRALQELLADGDLAWRAYAAGLLGEELAG
jgi:hypothetical protein